MWSNQGSFQYSLSLVCNYNVLVKKYVAFMSMQKVLLEPESELEVRILEKYKMKFKPVVPGRRSKKQRLLSLSSILYRIHEHIYSTV